MVLVNLKGYFFNLDYFFYWINYGVEIDFVLFNGYKIVVVECKVFVVFKLIFGNYVFFWDINFDYCYIVVLVFFGYFKEEGIEVVLLYELIFNIGEMFI